MSLTPERWQEILCLYEAASALEAAEREAYLARECSDPELLAEVRKMLAAAAAKEFLEPPPLEGPTPGRDLGDFTLLEEIGRGGMGVVYRALQRPLKRIVAVKVLPASFALSQRQIDRFLREARSAARLSHPNLVSVLTVGDERGVRFFAMEYVAGHNLHDEIVRLRADLKADKHDHAHLPSSRSSDYFRSVAECVRQVADGLAYAHEHHVIHRDVKPSNLLLDSTGRVKLVDFGLARDEEQGSLSNSGDVLGTPHYMSPEQARAHKHKVDHRTDIYSLGVVMFELLTLQRPFEGKTSQEVIQNLLSREPPRIRKLNHRVPRDLETICLTAMAKGPEQRYKNAAALRDDLQRFLSHEAIVARPPGAFQIILRRTLRHRTLFAGVSTALLALALGGAATRGLELRARSAENLAAIRAALAQGPLEAMPPDRLLELKRWFREARTESGVLAVTDDDALHALEQAFAALQATLRRRGLADLAVAKDATQPDGIRELRRLSGWRTLQQAAQVFPEDEDLQRLAAQESLYPTISVRAVDDNGAAIPADVYLREVDVLTSGVAPRRRLGATPLLNEQLLPGYYRIVVVFQAGGFRELICNPGPANMELELIATRRADEETITIGMIQLDGPRYLFADDEGEEGCDWALEGKAVGLEPYYLDATEVSNADYQRFVVATGHVPPVYWRFISNLQAFLAERGDYPVVGVGWKDAVAFAEWKGKRLPTAAEWLRAAGGHEHRPYPFSADPLAPAKGNISAPYTSPRGGQEAWTQYLDHALPVRSSPEACTPEGAYNLFGNVYELTESMMVDKLDGNSVLMPRPFDRLSFGGAWNAMAARQAMRAPEYVGIGPYHEQAHLGFRCARSIEP